MKQIEALQLIANEKALWMGMMLQGRYTAYSAKADKSIPAAVWERLLGRGDVELQEAWGVNDKYLVLTEQGRKRLEEAT